MYFILLVSESLFGILNYNYSTFQQIKVAQTYPSANETVVENVNIAA
jgi:hypothetical protein